MKVCIIDGCENKQKAKGYCNKHYVQLKRCGKILTGKEKKICIVDGCDNIQRAKGYCNKHYSLFRKYGHIPLPKDKKCCVPGCNNDTKSKGYCSKHYEQQRRTGRILPDREIIHNKACRIAGCNGKYRAKGYCIKHYEEIRRHGEIKPATLINHKNMTIENQFKKIEQLVFKLSFNARQLTQVEITYREPSEIINFLTSCLKDNIIGDKVISKIFDK